MYEKCHALTDTSQWCPNCQRQLETSTDWSGNLLEWCPNQCLEPRPVVRRRLACPSCGSGQWTEMAGCRLCGHGVKIDKRAKYQWWGSTK